jgi:hypothetical protein
MTRDAVTRTNKHGGLYATLAEREARALANGGTLPNVETGTSYAGSAARLALFRAGLPVALCAWDVPVAVRGGERSEVLTWRRAVVHPDGAVDIRVATIDEVLADLGL